MVCNTMKQCFIQKEKQLETAEEKECQPLHNKNITLYEQVPQKKYVYTNIYLTLYGKKSLPRKCQFLLKPRCGGKFWSWHFLQANEALLKDCLILKHSRIVLGQSKGSI